MAQRICCRCILGYFSLVSVILYWTKENTRRKKKNNNTKRKNHTYTRTCIRNVHSVFVAVAVSVSFWHTRQSHAGLPSSLSTAVNKSVFWVRWRFWTFNLWPYFNKYLFRVFIILWCEFMFFASTFPNGIINGIIYRMNNNYKFVYFGQWLSIAGTQYLRLWFWNVEEL